MEIIRLDATNIAKTAARAAKVLRAGGIILYPTDTLYGLGADAFSDDAVGAIYRTKGRKESKPIHCIVDSLEMAARFGEMPELVRSLTERLPKGKVTFVVRKKDGLDAGICKGVTTFGFRIPDNEFCLAVSRAFGGPYTATSANVSGEAANRNVGAILSQLGGRAKGVDLVIDAGELPESKPSTVIDLSGPKPKILREGAVSAQALAGSI